MRVTPFAEVAPETGEVVATASFSSTPSSSSASFTATTVDTNATTTAIRVITGHARFTARHDMASPLVALGAPTVTEGGSVDALGSEPRANVADRRGDGWWSHRAHARGTSRGPTAQRDRRQRQRQPRRNARGRR